MFRSSTTGIMYNILQKLNCNSKNVIYLLTCKVCDIQYVGETGTRFRERMNNHKSAINNAYATSVARHYNSAGHSLQSVEILPIEQNQNRSEQERGNRDETARNISGTRTKWPYITPYFPPPLSYLALPLSLPFFFLSPATTRWSGGYSNGLRPSVRPCVRPRCLNRN